MRGREERERERGEGGSKRGKGRISSAPLCDWKFNRGRKRRERARGRMGGREREKEREKERGRGEEERGKKKKAQRPHCCVQPSAKASGRGDNARYGARRAGGEGGGREGERTYLGGLSEASLASLVL